MPGTSRSRAHGGRIHIHERDVDDQAPIIGESLDLGEDFHESLQGTLSKQMDDRTRRNYRNRLKRMMEFWGKNHNDYYKDGVRDVTEEELKDPSKYYFKKFKKEVIYTGLNVKLVLAFLLETQKKEDGKIKSFDDIRKYKDAIQWGAATCHERLPTTFYVEIEKYLKSYRRVTQAAKKRGEMEDQGSDPIPVSLYQLILRWSIEANNIFLWFWTLTQWACMARCSNVDPLGFHNFKLGSDSIICKYDDAKADKEGEKLSEKNIYSNPFDYQVCWWTGFGVYCCVNSADLGAREFLFLKPTAREGTASNRYQGQLTALLSEKVEVVCQHMRVDHANAYGIRKGSATLATTGTTCPPPLPSVARRGEWSLGAVLDVYWHFSVSGDEYLGRVLALLDPNKPDFASLPPHFVMENPMENHDVAEAMSLCYFAILQKHPETGGLLLRGLACIIHHSDALFETARGVSGHDFHRIPILQRPEETIGDRVVEAVEGAIDRKAWDSGTITPQHLEAKFSSFKDDIKKAMREEMGELRTAISAVAGTEGAVERVGASSGHRSTSGGPGGLFTYRGAFYQIPEDFIISGKPTLRQALMFWVCGQNLTADGSSSVRPFRQLSLKLLPAGKSRDTLRQTWKPFFTYLEGANVNFSQDGRDLSAAQIESMYEKCIDFLKEA